MMMVILIIIINITMKNMCWKIPDQGDNNKDSSSSCINTFPAPADGFHFDDRDDYDDDEIVDMVDVGDDDDHHHHNETPRWST